MEGTWVIIFIIFFVVLFTTIVTLLARIRKCPSDKIMVISGKVGNNADGTNRSSKCIHGGVAFIWPIVQQYQFLDLSPISISIDLKQALSKQNIRIDVPSIFTVGISTEAGIMQNAAERLLTLRQGQIQELAKDIIFGQLRLVIATMDIEEINTDRDKFLEAVSKNVELELKKIGLRLINVNVTDINDESGYIKALGQEAAAKAINDAKKSVAEKNRDGEIGQANAQRDQRIEVALANSQAIKGENEAKISVSQSEALRREKEAEALKSAVAAEKIQAAKALEEAYAAQQQAELARAALELATKEADVIVSAEIQKKKVELDAEAEAEKIRRHAKGEADAIFSKMQAEAKGLEEILLKRAAGLKALVAAANNSPNQATQLLIADKLETLVGIQVEAIKNIKFDKVTVWDSNGGNGKEGSSTSNFLSSLIKSVPPLHEVFRNSGLQMPEILGKEIVEAKAEPKKE